MALANANGTTGVSYHDYTDATQIEEWTLWIIDLQVFTDQGADLTKVDTISIGFGDKNNSVAGGRSKMWFDDIRLYRSSPQEPKQ